MTGFLFAFGSAFFASTSDALAKQSLHNHSVLVTAWVRLAYASPFLLPLLYFIPVPPLDHVFWFTIVALLPLETGALVLYMKALQISPLSLTVPFLSLTPAFTVLTSFLILGEKPDLSGVLGISLIVVGAYLLNVHLSKKGIFKPFQAITSERGSLLMTVVAFIYSITSSLGKLAIEHSSPAFMGIVYLPLLSLSVLPFAVRSGMRISALRSGGTLFVLIGVSQVLMTLCHFKAISMVLVSYIVAVKQMSILLSVLFGGMFFREKYLKDRLMASLLMFLGILVIVL